MTIFGGLTSAGDLLARNARVMGRDTGLIFGDTRLAWREANARANRFANSLQHLGVQRGDRVALYARNSHQWVEALFGLAKIGAVSVTVNYRLAAPEVEYIVKDAGATAIICDESTAANARAAANNCHAIKHIIGINTHQSGFENYESLVNNGDEHEPIVSRRQAAGSRQTKTKGQRPKAKDQISYDEPAMLLYTSGTTGFPKGAVYTHGSLLVGMLVHVLAIASNRAHRVMLPSPLYSAAGIAGIYCAVYAGSQIALINYDVKTACETIEREKITFTNLVPTTIQMLLAHEESLKHDLTSLETLLYGGSPIPEPVLREAMHRFPRCGFRQTFATTETGCAGTVLEPRDHREALDNPQLAHRLQSCGRQQVNVDVRVTDADGNTLPPEETGEICVRTEANMLGYWNNPAATAKTLRDGWLYTGDMARMDEDGYFYLVDRKNDMIVSGALNVYPSEVERVLQQHPDVYEVAVIGVPSEKWGEAVKAVVALKAGAGVSESELIQFCEGKIAGFKKPKSVEFVEKLPRNLTGKILRRELREKYWQGEERKV
jgi:acyl-CoA synthetase (AMP-forming)/AMP-acid ligase II